MPGNKSAPRLPLRVARVAGRLELGLGPGHDRLRRRGGIGRGLALGGFRRRLLGLCGGLAPGGGGALGGDLLVDRRARLELVERLVPGLCRLGGAVLECALVGRGVGLSNWGWRGG